MKTIYLPNLCLKRPCTTRPYCICYNSTAVLANCSKLLHMKTHKKVFCNQNICRVYNFFLQIYLVIAPWLGVGTMSVHNVYLGLSAHSDICGSNTAQARYLHCCSKLKKVRGVWISGISWQSWIYYFEALIFSKNQMRCKNSQNCMKKAQFHVCFF